MRDAELVQIDDEMIVIDLSDNQTPIIEHPYYTVYRTQDKIRIKLSKEKSIYNIQYGKAGERTKSIEILGNPDAEVIISNTHVLCNKIEVHAKEVVVEEGSLIQSGRFIVKASALTLYGKILARKADFEFLVGSVGFTNEGVFRVSEEYKQKNGSFLTRNFFDATQSVFDCDSIYIFGVFNGKSTRLNTEKNLLIDEHAQCLINEIKCRSKGKTFLAGKMSASGDSAMNLIIDIESRKLFVASTASFEKYHSLVFNATKVAQLSQGIRFDEVKKLTAEAEQLLFECSVPPVEEIFLNGRREIVTSEASVVEATQKIQVKGANATLKGTLRGNVETPEFFNHFHLTESSVIENTEKMQVKGKLIEAQGKMAVKGAVDFHGQASVATSTTSVTHARKVGFVSAFIHVAGTYSVTEEFKQNASQFLQIDALTTVDADWMISLAPWVLLQGLLCAKVFAKGERGLCNQATVENKGDTTLMSNGSLLGLENSAIDSNGVKLVAPRNYQFGQVKGSGYVREEGMEIYNAASSTFDSALNDIAGDAVTLAGGVKGKKSQVQSTDKINTLSTHAFLTDTTIVHSQYTFEGPFNVKGESAGLVAGDSANVTSGEAKLSKALTVSSYAVDFQGRAETDECVFGKNSDRENSELNLKNAQLSASKLRTDHDHCNAEASALDVRQAEFDNKKSVHLVKCNVSYKEQVRVKTKDFQGDSVVIQPKSDNKESDKSSNQSSGGFFVDAQMARTGLNSHFNVNSPVYLGDPLWLTLQKQKGDVFREHNRYVEKLFNAIEEKLAEEKSGIEPTTDKKQNKKNQGLFEKRLNDLKAERDRFTFTPEDYEELYKKYQELSSEDKKEGLKKLSCLEKHFLSKRKWYVKRLKPFAKEKKIIARLLDGLNKCDVLEQQLKGKKINREAKLGGEFNGPSLTVHADAMRATSSFHVSKNTGTVIFEGASASSVVNIDYGSLIESKIARIKNVERCIVSGTLSAQEIEVKIKELLVDTFGRVGVKDSKVSINADNFTLEGILEAKQAMVRCYRTFFQYYGKINVSKIELNAPFIFTWLGETEANSLNYSSYFEFGVTWKTLVNWDVRNSFVRLVLAPRFLNLTEIIETLRLLKDKKFSLKDMTFLDGLNKLTYGLQSLYTLCRFLFPKVALLLYAALTFLVIGLQIYAFYLEAQKRDLSFAGALPYLVILKNIIISGLFAILGGISFFQDATPWVNFNSGMDVASALVALLSIALPSTYADAFINLDLANFFTFTQSLRGIVTANAFSPFALNVVEMGMGQLYDVSPHFTWNESLSGHYVLQNFTFGMNVSVSSDIYQQVPRSMVAGHNVTISQYELGHPRVYVDRYGSLTLPHYKLVGGPSSEQALVTLDKKGEYGYLLPQGDTTTFVFDPKHLGHDISLTSQRVTTAPAQKGYKPSSGIARKSNASQTQNSVAITSSEHKADEQSPKLKDKSNTHVSTKKHPAPVEPVLDIPFNEIVDASCVTLDGVVVKAEAGKGLLGLVANQGSVTLNNAEVDAATVMISAFKNVLEIASQITATTLSVNAHMGDFVEIKQSKNTANTAQFTAGNDFIDDASTNECKSGASVHVGHDFIIRAFYHWNTSEEAVKTQSRVIYIPGMFVAGEQGLTVVAGHDILNHASYMQALGDLILNAGNNIVATMEHYRECVYSNGNMFHHKEVWVERVLSAVFQSVHGALKLIASSGTLDAQTAKFLAATSLEGSFKFSPIFRDFVTHTVVKTSGSFLGIPVYESTTKIRETINSLIISPLMMKFVVEYGNLYFPNINIDTKDLILMTPNGDVSFSQDKIKVEIHERYVTLSLKLGPINISYSFSPSAKDPLDVSVVNPLYKALHGVLTDENPDRRNGDVYNATEAGAGIGNKLLQGNYASALGIASVGGGVSGTDRSVSYEMQGRNSIHVENFEATTRDGVTVSHENLNATNVTLHGSSKLSSEGDMLKNSAQETTVGVSGEVGPGSVVTGTASGSYFSSQGVTAAPNHITITGELKADKPLNISLKNSTMTGEKSSAIGNVSMQGATSEQHQRSIAGSVGTNSFSAAVDRVEERTEVPTILSVKSVSGGEGRYQQTESGSVRTEIGGALSVSFGPEENGKHKNNEYTLSGATGGYTNTCDTTYADGSISHSGTDLELDAPIGLTKLGQTVAQHFSENPPPPQMPQDDGISVNENRLEEYNSPNYSSQLGNLPGHAKPEDTNPKTAHKQQKITQDDGMSITEEHLEKYMSPDVRSQLNPSQATDQKPYQNNNDKNKTNAENLGKALVQEMAGPLEVAYPLADLALDAANTFADAGMGNNSFSFASAPPETSHHELTQCEQYDYPAGDFIMGFARGLGDVAMGLVMFGQGAVSIYTDASTVAIYNFQQISPGLWNVSQASFDAAQTRMAHRAIGLFYFASNLATNVVMNAPSVVEDISILGVGEFARMVLSGNTFFQQNYNQAQYDVIERLGLHNFVYDITGPEQVERTVAFWAPAAVFSKVERMMNMAGFGIEGRPLLFPYIENAEVTITTAVVTEMPNVERTPCHDLLRNIYPGAFEKNVLSVRPIYEDQTLKFLVEYDNGGVLVVPSNLTFTDAPLPDILEHFVHSSSDVESESTQVYSSAPHSTQLPLSALKENEVSGEFNYYISPEGHLLISSERMKMPFVLAEGAVEFEDGDIVGELLEPENPLYYSRGEHLGNFVEHTFSTYGFSDIKGRFVRDVLPLTLKQLETIPPPICLPAVFDSVSMTVYGGLQQANVETDHGQLTHTMPWHYSGRDFFWGVVTGLLHSGYGICNLIESLVIVGSDLFLRGIQTNLAVFGIRKNLLLIDQGYYEDALTYLANTPFARIGVFAWDEARQCALFLMVWKSGESSLYYEAYLAIKSRQDGRIASVRQYGRDLLFYRSGPDLVHVVAEILSPAIEFKFFGMIKNYRTFGMGSHPPVFKPSSTRIDCENHPFVNGEKNWENYALTVKQIRDSHFSGSALFIITPKGKLIMADSVAARDLHHPMITKFKPVVLAGEFYFKEGKLIKWDAGSGNYLPYGQHLEQMGTKVLVKHGFTEAPGKFDHKLGDKFAGNPGVYIGQWKLPLYEAINMLIGYGHVNSLDQDNDNNAIALSPAFFEGNTFGNTTGSTSSNLRFAFIGYFLARNYGGMLDSSQFLFVSNHLLGHGLYHFTKADKLNTLSYELSISEVTGDYDNSEREIAKVTSQSIAGRYGASYGTQLGLRFCFFGPSFVRALCVTAGGSIGYQVMSTSSEETVDAVFEPSDQAANRNSFFYHPPSRTSSEQALSSVDDERNTAVVYFRQSN